MEISPDLQARLARVKLFLCDVDGILTDGTVFIGQEQEVKQFHIRDGLGLLMLQKEGVKVGWVSNRPSSATQKRAEELRVDFLYQGKGSKVETVEKLLAEKNFQWADVCYLGDDVVDLGVMKRASVAATVADGIVEAKAIAHYVTQAGGGRGGVREVVELILKARGRWEQIVADYTA